jgi:hypothetical protein
LSVADRVPRRLRSTVDQRGLFRGERIGAADRDLGTVFQDQSPRAVLLHRAFNGGALTSPSFDGLRGAARRA